jgi:hypothetical protein
MLDDHASSSEHPIEEAIDEAEKESFPASDPQSSWAGPDPVALASEPTSPAPDGSPTSTGNDGSAGPETPSVA